MRTRPRIDRLGRCAHETRLTAHRRADRPSRVDGAHAPRDRLRRWIDAGHRGGRRVHRPREARLACIGTRDVGVIGRETARRQVGVVPRRAAFWPHPTASRATSVRRMAGPGREAARIDAMESTARGAAARAHRPLDVSRPRSLAAQVMGAPKSEAPVFLGCTGGATGRTDAREARVASAEPRPVVALPRRRPSCFRPTLLVEYRVERPASPPGFVEWRGLPRTRVARHSSPDRTVPCSASGDGILQGSENFSGVPDLRFARARR